MARTGERSLSGPPWLAPESAFELFDPLHQPHRFELLEALDCQFVGDPEEIEEFEGLVPSQDDVFIHATSLTIRQLIGYLLDRRFRGSG